MWESELYCWERMETGNRVVSCTAGRDWKLGTGVSCTAGRDWRLGKGGELHCWERLETGNKRVAFLIS